MAQSMEKTRARAAFNEEAAEGVVMEVSDKADLKAIDKYHQADASMHTLEAWERRFALRRDKDVRQALHLWWTAALRTIQAENPEIEIPVLDKETYIRIYKLIFRALAKEVREKYDEEEAIECAEEDWAADSRDGETMPREQFMDSLFQIADLYTDDAVGSDYAVFLERQLGRCLAKGFKVGDEKATFWKVKPPKKPKKEKGAGQPSPVPTESSVPTASEPPTEPPSEPPSEAASVRPIATPEATMRPISQPKEPEEINEESELPSRVSTPDSLHILGDVELPELKKKKKKKKEKSRNSSIAPSPATTLSEESSVRGMAPATKREAVERPVTEKFVAENMDPWRSGRDVNSLSGAGGPSMDWRDKDEEKEKVDHPIWKSPGVAGSPDVVERMDWGEREVEKEEPFVLKSPRRVERKKKRRAQRARKSTVKVQSHARKKQEVKKFEETKAAVVKLQSHARAHTARGQFLVAKAAAQLIQALVRRQHPPTPPPPPEIELPPYELPPLEPDPPPPRRRKRPSDLYLDPVQEPPLLTAEPPSAALVSATPKARVLPPPPPPPGPRVIYSDPLMPTIGHVSSAPELRPTGPVRGPLDRIKSPIYVRTLEDVTYEFRVTDQETVADLKNMVRCVSRGTTPGLPTEAVRVTFKGHDLMDEKRKLSDYAVWKLSYLECAPVHAMQKRSSQSVPDLRAARPLIQKWERPPPDVESAPQVLHEVAPIYTERRMPNWKAEDSSWESDFAARNVMKRIGREEPDDLVMTTPNPLESTRSFDPYIPDLGFYAGPNPVPFLGAKRMIPAGKATSMHASTFRPLSEETRAHIKTTARAAYRPMKQQLRAISHMGEQIGKQPLGKNRPMRSSGSLPSLKLQRQTLPARKVGHYVEFLELASIIRDNSICAAGALEPLKRGVISNQVIYDV